MKNIRYLLSNIHSLLRDGRTFGQKKRYIRLHHPTLYKHLYEEQL